ncbi:MAG: hypothetical protein RL148_520 [Planctomycetota bacterium]|jgi:hypothetical protein
MTLRSPFPALAAGALLATLGRGQSGTTRLGEPSWVLRPGEGITLDGGEDFRLNLKNRVQLRWEATAAEGTPDTQEFRVRRARTSLSGHAYRPELQYKLQLSWTEPETPIKDAWVQWDFLRDAGQTVGFRTGQADPHYGLEGTGSSSGLLFVERSDATKFFADSRARGAWLHGIHRDATVRWTLGATNHGMAAGMDGDPTGDNTDNELVWMAAANFDPLGDFVGGGRNLESLTQGDLADTPDPRVTLGAAVAHNGQEQDVFGTGSPTTSESATLNTMARWRGWWLGVEVFWRWDETEAGNHLSHDGFYAAIGWTMPVPEDGSTQWGFAARWSERCPDPEVQGVGTSGNDFDAVRELSLGLNAFHRGHPLKTQLGVTQAWDDTTDDQGFTVVLQWQVTI